MDYTFTSSQVLLSVRLALDNGFWCGMTLYPTTKCTPARAADIIELRRFSEVATWERDIDPVLHLASTVEKTNTRIGWIEDAMKVLLRLSER